MLYDSLNNYKIIPSTKLYWKCTIFFYMLLYLQLFLEWVILQLIYKEFEPVSIIQIITITQKENQNIEDHSGENLYFNLQIEGVKKTWRVNPLIPKKEQKLFSPHSITPVSLIKVTRIKEIISNYRTSWLLNKFSSSAP